MWQRFSERARKVVFYSQEEAQKFGDGYVSTEHLLLGLVRESDSVAAQVLDRLGVSLNRVRAEVEKQLPRGDARPNQDMTLTPRAKRVIDLSYDEARQLGNNYIGTEHLLLGLIREGDGLAGKVLTNLGVGLETTRTVVMAIQVNDQGPIKVSSSHATTDPQETRMKTQVTRDWTYQLTLSRVQEWANWANQMREEKLPLAEEIAALHLNLNATMSSLEKNLLLALCLEIQEGGSLENSENWKNLRLTKEQAQAIAQIGAELRKLLDE